MISTIMAEAPSTILRRRVMDNSSRRGVMARSSHVMTTVNVITVASLWIRWSSSVFFCRRFLWQMHQSNQRLSIRRLIHWPKFIKFLLGYPTFSTWVLLPTTIMLLPLPTLLPLLTLLPTLHFHDALDFQEHSLKLLSHFYVN
jgi:hypothetical protein